MLCSNCKKNTAVVFINKKSSDGKQELDGLCYDCAKKMGINPFDTLIKQANLTPIAITIFWYTIRKHFFEILIAFEILIGSSSIKTISAASIAASEPIAPIAIPMSG